MNEIIAFCQMIAPYAVVVGGLILIYFLDKDAFQKIVLAAFLAVEKELGTAENQEKMVAAVEKVIETLPTGIKWALEMLAKLRDESLHQLLHDLCQSVYDTVFKQLHP